VWLLGGQAAISEEVAAQIAELGPQVRRVAGEDRFGTAALVAGEVHTQTAEVALALGRHSNPEQAWPDAVAAGALAATSARIPTLLSTVRALPPPTDQALETLGVRKVLLIGGTAAIRSAVADELKAQGYEVERLAGENRYGTSAAVATKARSYHQGATPLVLASGAGYADALSAGALAARVGGPLLLAPPCALEQAPVTARHLDGDAGSITQALLVGGESAVSERVRWQVGEALHR
jgi:hypothetical protein